MDFRIIIGGMQRGKNYDNIAMTDRLRAPAGNNYLEKPYYILSAKRIILIFRLHIFLEITFHFSENNLE